MPEAQARVRRGGERPATRGGIPAATGVSDRREEGSGRSRGRPNAGKRRPATAAAARPRPRPTGEAGEARRGWWAGIWNSVPEGHPLEPRRGDTNASLQDNRWDDPVIALARACIKQAQ